jgi:hypothetical protein
MSANDYQPGGDHYRKKNPSLQHWDIVERYGVGYLEGCGTKYLCRWRDKGGMLDLEKALHYCDKLVDLVIEGVRLPRGIVPVPALTLFLDEQGINDRWQRSLLFQFFRWESLEHLIALRHDLNDYVATQKGPTNANS